MKVAHLTTVDMSLRFLLMPQLRAVVDAGGEAVGISAPGPWVAELEAAGIRHIPLQSSTRGFDLLADVRAAVELWRILRRERFDVLHTHNPKPGLYGRILGRLAGVPIVVNTVHGLYATEDDRVTKRAVVYGLEGVASRFSDAELFQNPEDVDMVRRYHLAPMRHVSVLGNGIDLTRFDPADAGSPPARERRRELGVDDDEILVGAVGRLVAEKGYGELFDAMDRLGPRYRLVVIGGEDLGKADAVSSQAIDVARSMGVIFLGHRDDVERWYATMDVFVLASHREGFPRVAMEAAAMGLPLVLTDIRGCRQVVDDGVNGILVPKQDPASLAAALLRLGESADLRRRMGDAGVSKARAEFDEQRCVEKVLGTYRDVARRKELPA